MQAVIVREICRGLFALIHPLNPARVDVVADTVGLSKHWAHSLVYCSEITGNLLVHRMNLPSDRVAVLPMHRRVTIQSREEDPAMRRDVCKVTLIDAHHCPGAVIFVFELPPFASDAESIDFRNASIPAINGHGPVHVHVGDFRYHSSMNDLFLNSIKATELNASNFSQLSSQHRTLLPYVSSALELKTHLTHLQRLKIDSVYLDTTYCISDVYQFIPQSTALKQVVSLVRTALTAENANNAKVQMMDSHKGESTLTKLARVPHMLFGKSDSNSKGVTGVVSSISSLLSGYRPSLQHTLILVGSYSIGKEKVFLSLARAFRMKIYVHQHRLALLQCINLFESTHLDGLEQAIYPAHDHQSDRLRQQDRALLQAEWSDWSLDSVFTTDMLEARIHVVPMTVCSLKGLSDYIDPLHNPHMKSICHKVTHVIAVRPTGWTNNDEAKSVNCEIDISLIPVDLPRKRKVRGHKTHVWPKRRVHCSMVGLAYSEHSSYRELHAFVELMIHCGMQSIVPTVQAWKANSLVRQHFGSLLGKYGVKIEDDGAQVKTDAQATVKAEVNQADDDDDEKNQVQQDDEQYVKVEVGQSNDSDCDRDRDLNVEMQCFDQVEHETQLKAEDEADGVGVS